jgi:hypothetical protein
VILIDYRYRVESAKEYLTALNISLRKPWKEQFNLMLEEKLSIYEKLSLLSPLHLQNIRLPKHVKYENVIIEIQGKRNFKSEQGGKCDSQLIWGYDCFFDSNNISSDHLFPYSLGGPTSPNNKILLCRYHNMVKNSDIHFYPWEQVNSRSVWLNDSLEKISKTFISLQSFV